MAGAMRSIDALVVSPPSSTAITKADCRNGLQDPPYQCQKQGNASCTSLRGSFWRAPFNGRRIGECLSGSFQSHGNREDWNRRLKTLHYVPLQDQNVGSLFSPRCASCSPAVLLALHVQVGKAFRMSNFSSVTGGSVSIGGTRSILAWRDHVDLCCCSLGTQAYRPAMTAPRHRGTGQDGHRMGIVTNVSSVEEDVATENEETSVEDQMPRAILKRFPAFLRQSFRFDDLGSEIASIALPALFALAADPIASLVDTAYIGKLGAAQLGAVGISISVFNLMSKVFNVPLLNVTTSFVAEVEATSSGKDGFKGGGVLGRSKNRKRKSENPAVSSALVLGCVLGLCEALSLYFATEPVLSLMGLPMDSVMRPFAREYLSIRAMGAPAVVVSLATQGAFRGFGDTKSPLYGTIFGNVLNCILCPILIFGAGLGVRGAAMATNISEYLMAGYLLYSLGLRCSLVPQSLSSLKFGRFLGAGSLLLGRSVALLSSMTIATSMAARLGTVAMATHQVCVQVWLAASLLADSLALAGQSILAGAFVNRDKEVIRSVMHRVVLLGMGMGVLLSLMFIVGADAIPRAFTQDPAVLSGIAVIIPFVAGTQTLNSLAFVFDGIHYGGSDFKYAAYTTIAAVVPSIAVIIFAPAKLGLPGVWMGLTMLMSLRMLSGFTRVATKSGPWRILNEEEFPPEDGRSALEKSRVDSVELTKMDPDGLE